MQPEDVTLCEQQLKDALDHRVDYSVLLSAYVAELLLQMIREVREHDKLRCNRKMSDRALSYGSTIKSRQG